MKVEHKLALYNLEENAGENVDVSAAFPQIVAALSALAEVARKDLGDSLQQRIGEGTRPCGVAKTPAE